MCKTNKKNEKIYRKEIGLFLTNSSTEKNLNWKSFHPLFFIVVVNIFKDNDIFVCCSVLRRFRLGKKTYFLLILILL